MSRNLSALSHRQFPDRTLFEELGKAARENGTPSAEQLDQLAEAFLHGKANTYGTATFYDFLKPENRGKAVYVCNGSACLTAGTQPALKKALRQWVPEEAIGHMCCLGRCHQNAAFQYRGVNYSGLATEHLEDLFSGFERDSTAKQPDQRQDTYTVGGSGSFVLTAPFPGLQNWYALWEAMLATGDADIALDEVKSSGLRGRGGAGFPMHIKLESCRNTEARERFVVCNADEGDPGAYTDRFLLEQRPHAVLFGMMAACWMANARTGILYIRAEYPEAISICREAINSLYESGWLGENILGTGFSLDLRVIAAQGAYICGEETALLASIEGQRPEVRVRPPFPAQEGLFRMPTVVNNVETLAALHYILENGGDHFARIGKGRSTGTKLLSIDGHFNRPGVYEVDMGTPLQDLVEELGGGFRVPVKAMHIGGPLGGLVPVTHIGRLSVDFESFASEGFLLGHASVVCIPESFPLIRYLEHLFQFTAAESCGKCFPCRLGSVRGAEMLALAQSEKNPSLLDRTLFDDLLETLEKGSLCALGGGLPLPVHNALKHFSTELEPYFQPLDKARHGVLPH